MANLITVRLQRGEGQAWGFRLQGGKDFSSPLVLQRVNGGSVADQAGLLPGDALVKVNSTEVFNLRHKEAQDVIIAAGNSFELTVSRGSAWRPTVTPVGSLPSPTPTLAGNVTPVTKTSLAATPQPVQHIGSGHNQAAKPFPAAAAVSPVPPQLQQQHQQQQQQQQQQVNGGEGPIKSIVNKQYNTPVAMYSDETIAETLSSQAEVLAGGVLGVNFKKNERVYSPANSEVYKLLHEQGNEPEPVSVYSNKTNYSIHKLESASSHFYATQSHAIGGYATAGRLPVGPLNKPRSPIPPQMHQQPPSVPPHGPASDSSPVPVAPLAQRPAPQTLPRAGIPPRIHQDGVFVRIKDKNLHADCFKCATCGSSLKNQGYFNLNNKLYCDIHARLAAMQSPPPGTNGMVPVAITKPGQKTGVQAISAALNAHANLNGRSLSPYANNHLQHQTTSSGGSNTQSPSHSRSSSTTSSSGYCNSNSLSPVQSNKVSPRHSRTSSENELILEPSSNGVSASSRFGTFTTQCEFNFPPPPPPPLAGPLSYPYRSMENPEGPVETLQQLQPPVEAVDPASFGPNGLVVAQEQSADSTDAATNGAVTQNDYGFFYKTIGGSVIRSVFPPGTSSRYKNQNNITPKPFGAPLPVSSLAQPPASYPPVAGSVPTPFAAAVTGQSQAPAPAAAMAPLPASYPPAAAPAPAPVAIAPVAPAPAPAAAVPTQQGDATEEEHVQEQKFGREIPSQMENMPVPTGRVSMMEALATAPERPYTPFSEVQFERSEMYQNLLKEQPSIQIDPEKNYSAFASVAGNRSPIPFKPVMPEIRDEPIEEPIAEPEPEPEPKPDPEPLPVVEQKRENPERKVPPYPRKDSGVEHYSLAPRREVKSPLNHPAEIPTYQRKWYNLPTQNPSRTPESEELRQNVPVAFVDTHSMSHLAKPVAQAVNIKDQASLKKTHAFTTIQNRIIPVIQTPLEEDAELAQYNNAHSRLQAKGVVDRGQSFTPSLILSKHSTTIPYYQHQLGFEEYFAESKEFDGRRTPQPVRKSPAFGPPPNPLKAHVPPSREGIPVESGLYLSMGKLHGVPWYTNKDHIPADIQQKMQQQQHGMGGGYTAPRQQSTVSYQHQKPMTTLVEQRDESTVQTRYHESALRDPASSERTTASASQVGNALIQKRTRTVEEHEHTEATKNVEIAKFSTKIKEDEAPPKGLVAQQARRFSGQDESLNIPPQLQEQPTAQEQLHPQQQQQQSVQSFPTANFPSSFPQATNTFPTVALFPEPAVDKFPTKSSRKASILLPTIKSSQPSSQGTGFKAQFNEFMVGEGALLPQREGSTKELTQSWPPQLPSYLSNTNPTVGAQSYMKPPLPSAPAPPAAPAALNGHRPSLNNSSIGFSNNLASSRSNNTDRSDASAGSGLLNKGRAACSTIAPTRGRGVLNKAVGPGGRVPLCGCCNQQIRGPFITALGRIWCPEHFICHNANCKRPLAEIGFVEEKGDLYCEYCFEEFLAPMCSKCNTRVKGDCLNAIGKQFHPECFKCTYCGKQFGNSPFFLEEGDPYCENDWNELFTTKCFACGFPVEAGDKWVEALNNNYHSQCFNCTSCKKNLEGQSFFAKGGRPFCKNHAR
ncbi:PDZ and LIM domain protein Zasp isoform X10 [Malaya genurostris]|uniref:PDZ and LIM domain protein Zasp isoform X10 n=1 Tax=Malaya genurostris TaxID=325434 RepID=UPI0026F3A722|nr:PDZ and LIM domain protein Zasp isoform X10 [Malaya genurostris]